MLTTLLDPGAILVIALTMLPLSATPRKIASPSVVTFTVSRRLDEFDSNSANGYCRALVDVSACTLRAEIMEANRSIEPTAQIIVPSETYALATPLVYPNDAEHKSDRNVATPASGNPVISIVGPGAPTSVIVVNDGSDGSCPVGTLTLRCAINFANANAFTNIRFASNVLAVLPQSALPTITGNGTWIDGSDSNGVPVGTRIDGIFMTTGNGLTINASYVTISRMKVVDMPSDGKDISIIGGKDNEISYDYLGILPGATQCPGFASGIGVGVAGDNTGGAGSSNGTSYIFGNTISCHAGSGVEIVSSNYVYVGIQRDGTSILGNNIGTTSDGTRAAGNGYAGVRVAANSDQIKIRANLIAYNSTAGVTFDGTNIEVLFNTVSANCRGLIIGAGTPQLVVGNNIGTSADGTLPWPNTNEGIYIVNGSGLILSDNLTAYNGGAGIAVVGSTTHAAIENNNSYNNRGLPIDLGDDGATVNGTRLPPGPNNWLPYPVVTAFSGSLVQGTKCAGCGVYIYKALGNPAAPGGGGIFVMNVPADGGGTWNANLPGGLTRLDVSFTALDSAHNASEMSPRPQSLLPLIVR